jgi:hypothetical protein
MTPTQIIGVERLELRFSPRPWEFAQQRRPQIDAHFAYLCERNPHLWNGRVLLLHDFALALDVFSGDYLETDFASFLAWQDWDFPDRSIRNCFGVAALRSVDDGFLLGVWPTTRSTPERCISSAAGLPNDIVADEVDLDPFSAGDTDSQNTRPRRIIRASEEFERSMRRVMSGFVAGGVGRVAKPCDVRRPATRGSTIYGRR